MALEQTSRGAAIEVNRFDLTRQGAGASQERYRKSRSDDSTSTTDEQSRRLSDIRVEEAPLPSRRLIDEDDITLQGDYSIQPYGTTALLVSKSVISIQQ